MSREHWTTWVCPFGCDVEYGSSSQAQNHLKHDHATEIAGENVETIADLSKKDDAKRAEGPCPLCHDVHIRSSRQYQTHVAHHLETLALFVLPQQDDSEDHDISDGTSISSPDGHAELDLNEEDDGVIKCICRYDDDDGATIFCEVCSTWQHIDCYYHAAGEAEKVMQEDFDHFCADCNPRPLSTREARERQKTRREAQQARQEQESGERRDGYPLAETDKDQDGAGQSKADTEQYLKGLEGHESGLDVERDAETLPIINSAEGGRLLETNSEANSPSSISSIHTGSPRSRDPELFATEDMDGSDTGGEVDKERAQVLPSHGNEDIKKPDEGVLKGFGGVGVGNWYCCHCKSPRFYIPNVNSAYSARCEDSHCSHKRCSGCSKA